MDLGATPGIVQSMPGDNGADGHADARSCLWSLRRSSLSPKSRSNKNMIFFIFLWLDLNSHLYSAGSNRNKSKRFGGFLLFSPALWPKVQGAGVVPRGQLLWFIINLLWQLLRYPPSCWVCSGQSCTDTSLFQTWGHFARSPPQLLLWDMQAPGDILRLPHRAGSWETLDIHLRLMLPLTSPPRPP